MVGDLDEIGNEISRYIDAGTTHIIPDFRRTDDEKRFSSEEQVEQIRLFGTNIINSDAY